LFCALVHLCAVMNVVTRGAFCSFIFADMELVPEYSRVFAFLFQPKPFSVPLFSFSFVLFYFPVFLVKSSLSYDRVN